MPHYPPITTVGTQRATSQKLGIRSEELGMFASQMDNASKFLVSIFPVRRDARVRPQRMVAVGGGYRYYLFFIFHCLLF